MPSAIPCSLSPFLSCIHSCLFSDWRRTVSSKFFDSQVSLISTEELVLPCDACCVFSCLCCSEYSLLLSSISLGLAESRILPAVSVDICPRTLLISFCTVQLRTLCTACSLATVSGPGPGELPSFWGSMVFCHAPISWKGLGNNNKDQM